MWAYEFKVYLSVYLSMVSSGVYTCVEERKGHDDLGLSKRKDALWNVCVCL